MTRWQRRIYLGAGLVVLLGASLPGRPAIVGHISPPPRFDGSISVLTYNVRGLPWPIGLGRPAALASIASRLSAMHASGAAPTIVVLQETFTEDSRRLGRAAGYRYVANGPAAADPDPGGVRSDDLAFAGQAHWWLGETQGKLVGSGLQILSDYPIVAVKRVAFPRLACAGYDCLANKGALLVTVAIPGASAPIDVVTTHLNSRTASWTADRRSIYAYRRQLEVLSRFIRDDRDPRHPLIVAGDFNVGSATPRRQALMNAVAHRWGAEAPVRDAYDEFVRQGGRLDDDGAYSRQRARDWQFYLGGEDADLALTNVTVPFGGRRQGRMLSDHVGYVARFRLIDRHLAEAGGGTGIRTRKTA